MINKLLVSHIICDTSITQGCTFILLKNIDNVNITGKGSQYQLLMLMSTSSSLQTNRNDTQLWTPCQRACQDLKLQQAFCTHVEDVSRELCVADSHSLALGGEFIGLGTYLTPQWDMCYLKRKKIMHAFDDSMHLIWFISPFHIV